MNHAQADLTIPNEIRCTYNKSYYDHGVCRKAATAVLETQEPTYEPTDPVAYAADPYGYDGGTTRTFVTRYAGRCAQHAGADKRRKYPHGKIVEFTPEIIRSMEVVLAETKARKEAEQQRQAAEEQERTVRHRAREFAEAEQEYVVVRSDEQGFYNFAESRKQEREVRHPDIPLVSENVESVWYRYPDDRTIDDLPGPIDKSSLMEYRYEPGRRLTVPEALVALSGYEYQACEHPAWRDSEAYAFVDWLRGALIRRIPGYAAADTWEITSR